MKSFIYSALCACLLSTANGAQIENPEALKPFFRWLAEAQREGKSVHVLQYGDSHTASDDWASTMRTIFQTDFGNGGSGFVTAGHIRAYRRFDTTSSNSAGWITQGAVGHTGDERNGLSGLSLTSNRVGETITLTTSAGQLQLWYLQQPGGGSFKVTCDGVTLATVDTDGPLKTGFQTISTNPGEHQYALTTTSLSPVRIFGWTADNNAGITWETLGINGAQVHMLTAWDPQLWIEQLVARNPSLVILAYGTNEALYPLFSAEIYRHDLLAAIRAIQQAVPDASILLIGPPDCDRRRRPFRNLSTVVSVQRQVAHQAGCAFWNWAQFMDQTGGRAAWVRAGLSQPDRVHLTARGYQLLGETLAREILLDFHRAEPADGSGTPGSQKFKIF